MLRAIEKERRSCIVYRTKREKVAGLYREKRPYSAKPRITAEARSRVPVPRLGLLLGMGAGEANGARKPPASCPSPPAPQTKEATGPYPQSTIWLLDRGLPPLGTTQEVTDNSKVGIKALHFIFHVLIGCWVSALGVR